ncbi:MAG TPA: MFS transporter [Solirubrobacteraceae bacterium]|jgi:EmrB/QacA subfamily drug resistance transporter
MSESPRRGREARGAWRVALVTCQSAHVPNIRPVATPREKQLTLLAAVLGTSVVFLDATVTSVALPAIRGDLGGGLAGQQWVTNAYLLALGSLLLIGGSLGDVLGQKRVFLVGVAGFGLTSALCAIASSIPELCVFRSMQGVCAALVTPTALAVIIHVFPEDERARAIGTWTALSSIVGVIGPFIGGVLIAAGSWRLIFVLNAPLVLVTVTLIARGVPASASVGTAGRLDFPGALLAALALSGSVFAVTEEPARGWSTLVIGSLATGVLGAIAFVAREARARAPMLPLNLFRERNFTIGNVATLTAYLGLGGVIFLLPVFLQEVSGYSPVQAGLALLPVTSLMIVLSRRFGALADRIGSRVLISLGAMVAGCGLLLLVRVDQRADYLSEVLPALLVFGLGLAMLVAPLTATVLGAVEEDHAGVAAAVNTTLSRVAQLFAVAVLGAVVSLAFASRVDATLRRAAIDRAGRSAIDRAKRQPLGSPSLVGVPPGERVLLRATFEEASVHAFRVADAIAAALVASGGLIAFAGIRNPRRRVAAELCPAGALCGASQELVHARRDRHSDRGFVDHAVETRSPQVAP